MTNTESAYDFETRRRAARTRAEEIIQIGQWFARHGLADRPMLTADDVLAARASDEAEAIKINGNDHLRAYRY